MQDFLSKLDNQTHLAEFLSTHTEQIQSQCLCSEQILPDFCVQKSLPLESKAYGSSPDIQYCWCGYWATQDAKKSMGK